MANALPCGEALQRVYHVKNRLIGVCRVPHVVPLRTSFPSGRQFTAVQLPDGRIVSDVVLETEKTALAKSMAHQSFAQSATTVKLFGAEAALRVYKTTSAFVLACYYMRKIDAHVDAVIASKGGLARQREGIAPNVKLTAADRPRLLARVLAHFREPADVGELQTDANGKRFYKTVKGKPKDNTELLKRIGGCGERSGRDFIKYEKCATADAGSASTNGELISALDFDVLLKAALAADRVAVPKAHKAALDKLPETLRKQQEAERKRGEKKASKPKAAPKRKKPVASADDDDDDADVDDKVPKKAPKRKKPVASTADDDKVAASEANDDSDPDADVDDKVPKKVAKRRRKPRAPSPESDEELDDEAAAAEAALLAEGDVDDDDDGSADTKWQPERVTRAKKAKRSATSVPGNATAFSALAERIAASDAVHNDPLEAGRADGARDVIGYVAPQFAAAAPLAVAGPSKFDKDGAALYLTGGVCSGSEPVALDEQTDELRVPITVPRHIIPELARLVALPELCSPAQRALLAQQDALRTLVNGDWDADQGKSSIVLRREHVDSARHWRECGEKFAAGVETAFLQLVAHGSAPSLLEQPEDTRDCMCVTERFDLPDGSFVHERGVIARRAFAKGERVGLFACAVVPGGHNELDGETALLRAAGVALADAEDVYAVSAKDLVQDEIVLSARRANRASILALVNHNSPANVELGCDYDWAAGGVWACALRNIEKCELLHLDYGAAYAERMRALGKQMGRSAGVKQPVQHQQMPPVEAPSSPQLFPFDQSQPDEFADLFPLQNVPLAPFSPVGLGLPFSPLKDQGGSLFGGQLDYFDNDDEMSLGQLLALDY